MTPNTDKIDDTVLALLHLTSFREGTDEFSVTRAWKGHDWQVLERLHQKGFISDPRNKNKSVFLTEEGVRQSEALFKYLFCDS